MNTSNTMPSKEELLDSIPDDDSSFYGDDDAPFYAPAGDKSGAPQSVNKE